MTTPYDTVVARFTYKPGIRFACQLRAGGGYELVLSTETHNSSNPEQITTFSVTRPIGNTASPEQIRDTLILMVQWWEGHERDEWMRWDGQRLREPHASGVVIPR